MGFCRCLRQDHWYLSLPDHESEATNQRWPMTSTFQIYTYVPIIGPDAYHLVIPSSNIAIQGMYKIGSRPIEYTSHDYNRLIKQGRRSLQPVLTSLQMNVPSIWSKACQTPLIAFFCFALAPLNSHSLQVGKSCDHLLQHGKAQISVWLLMAYLRPFDQPQTHCFIERRNRERSLLHPTREYVPFPILSIARLPMIFIITPIISRPTKIEPFVHNTYDQMVYIALVVMFNHVQRNGPSAALHDGFVDADVHFLE